MVHQVMFYFLFQLTTMTVVLYFTLTKQIIVTNVIVEMGTSHTYVTQNSFISQPKCLIIDGLTKIK